MKHNLVYAISFFMAFALVTVVLILLTHSYRNIFAFDFRPPEQNVKAAIAKQIPMKEIKKFLSEELKKEIADSLKNRRVQAQKEVKESPVDSLVVSRLNNVETELKEVKSNVENKNTEISSLKNKLQTKSDEEYTEWLKSTVKIYESMDARQAAKIINTISDNEARDIIYKMKKKKAAEILSYLNPEQVVKLTGTEQ